MHLRITRSLNILVASVVFLHLSACGFAVRTDTTTFFTSDYASSGVLFVQAGDAALAHTLEFKHYKRKVENHFSKQGYTISNSPDNADYIAFVTYGIDDGKGDTSQTTTVGFVTNVGGYAMPIFVSASSSNYEAIYTKVIAIDIVETESLKTGEPKQVYEIRGRSTDKRPHINCVFNSMLDSMFTGFPGINGDTQTLNFYEPECMY